MNDKENLTAQAPTDLPPVDPSPKTEVPEEIEKRPYEELVSENERLNAELEKLKEDMARRIDAEEKEKALKHLENLLGSKADPMYQKAVQRGEQQEELRGLPYLKRYEMGCLLCLGEEELQQNGRENRKTLSAPPLFSGSNGDGQIPSMPVKTPTDFETARENAKKYFGVR